MGFIAGEISTNMYITTEGRLAYVRNDTDGGDEKIDPVESTEDVISEPVLWTPTWVHLGCLSAVTECELLLLDPNGFREIVHRNPVALRVTVKYAQDFIKDLNSMKFDSLSDITRIRKQPRHSSLLSNTLGSFSSML